MARKIETEVGEAYRRLWYAYLHGTGVNWTRDEVATIIDTDDALKTAASAIYCAMRDRIARKARGK